MSLEVPEDFDAFWQEARAEADAVALECDRSFKNVYDWPGFTVESLAFRGVDGSPRHGWLSYPPGARRLPGFLWIAPYGRESVLPNEYGTRPGFASLSFNFHGLDSFHQEKYAPDRGYFAEGAGDPSTWVFRRMIQDCLIALRVLQAQVEVDAERIGVMGMSQGGGLAISCGAQSLIVKAVCADMPFLGNMEERLSGNVHRYPMKELLDFMENEPLGKERLFHTLSYFDSAIQATRCRVPTHVSLGLRDPASKPDSVRAIFDALPGPKELSELDWGHDWNRAMVTDNQAWLERWS
jgi:cephalosporin-C deacetylase